MANFKPITKFNDLVIDRVDVLLDSDLNMLQGRSVVSSDTLLYAVTFKNNQGYVLMSKDNRVPVLVIADDGEFILNEESPSMGMFLINSKLYIEESIRIADSIEQANELHITPDSRIIVPGDGDLVFVKNEYVYSYESTSNLSSGGSRLYTKWHQNAPLNNFLPNCSVCGNKPPLGCLQIAAAQIITEHGYWESNNVIVFATLRRSPYAENLGGYIRDFNTLVKECANTFKTTYAHQSSGHHVGPSLSQMPTTIARMANLGYKANSWSRTYDPNSIINDLKQNKPVLISGVDPNAGGHAWILDQYKQLPAKLLKIYQVFRNTSTGQEVRTLIFDGIDVPRQTLIHCNWGWDGLRNPDRSNGFYNSGVWNVAAAYSYDDPNKPGRTLNFTDNIRITSNLRPKPMQ